MTSRTWWFEWTPFFYPPSLCLRTKAASVTWKQVMNFLCRLVWRQPENRRLIEAVSSVYLQSETEILPVFFPLRSISGQQRQSEIFLAADNKVSTKCPSSVMSTSSPSSLPMIITQQPSLSNAGKQSGSRVSPVSTWAQWFVWCHLKRLELHIKWVGRRRSS